MLSLIEYRFGWRGTQPTVGPMGDSKPIVSIRRARAADVDELVALAGAVASEGRWIAREGPIDLEDGRRHLGSFLDADDRVVFVAESDGRLIGNLSLSVESYGVADLGMLVADGWRGRGVGSALLRRGIRWADEQGAHKVALQVWPHNDAARALYRKFGFVEEGRLVRHYRRRNGELWDAVVMGLRLEHDAPSSSLGGEV